MPVVETEDKDAVTLRSRFTEIARSTTSNLAEAQAAAVELERRIRDLTQVSRVLRGLPNGWRSVDRGKYAPACNFVDEAGRMVVVRELLPEGVTKFEGTYEEWQEYERQRGYGRSRDVVPPYVPVLTLDEVAAAPCPECGTEQPLIESYQQTYDSPSGDTWEKQHLVLCCEKVQVISREERDHRF